jgi:hypothetical protein
MVGSLSQVAVSIDYLGTRIATISLPLVETWRSFSVPTLAVTSTDLVGTGVA